MQLEGFTSYNSIIYCNIFTNIIEFVINLQTKVMKISRMMKMQGRQYTSYWNYTTLLDIISYILNEEDNEQIDEENNTLENNEREKNIQPRRKCNVRQFNNYNKHHLGIHLTLHFALHWCERKFICNATYRHIQGKRKISDQSPLHFAQFYF